MLRPSILCTLDLIHSDFVLSLSLSLDLPLAAEYFKLAGGESNIGYTLDRKGSAHRYLTLAPTNKNILRVRKTSGKRKARVLIPSENERQMTGLALPQARWEFFLWVVLVTNLTLYEK